MSGLFRESMPVPLEMQIESVEREIRMREKVYPRRVLLGKMSPLQAEQETLAMKAVLRTLKGLLEAVLAERAERAKQQQPANNEGESHGQEGPGVPGIPNP